MSTRLWITALAAFSFHALLPPGQVIAQTPKQTEAEVASAMRALLDSASVSVLRSLSSGRGSEFRIGDRSLNLTQLEQSATALTASPREAALGHRLMGLLHIVRQKYDEAETSLSASIAIAPEAHTHYMRGFTRLARGRRADGIADLTACLALKPTVDVRAECQATVDHAKRNPTGETWTKFRDERDGVAFEHPADWDVLSTKTSKVYDYLLSVGLSRDAASQLAAGVKQNAGAFFIVNPYDATAMTVEIRDVGKAVPKDTVVNMWRPVAANAAQFERQNVSLYHGIRVRTNTLADAGGAVRIDFTFGFELPIADTYVPAAGWRTMIFREKVPTRTARLEHVCGQPLAVARDAVWARFVGSLDFWIPAAR